MTRALEIFRDYASRMADCAVHAFILVILMSVFFGYVLFAGTRRIIRRWRTS